MPTLERVRTLRPLLLTGIDINIQNYSVQIGLDTKLGFIHKNNHLNSLQVLGCDPSHQQKQCNTTVALTASGILPHAAAETRSNQSGPGFLVVHF